MSKASKNRLVRFTSFVVSLLAVATIGFFGAWQLAHASERVIPLDNGAVVFLTEKKCTNKDVLEMATVAGVKKDLMPKLKEGKVIFQNRSINLCYVPIAKTADVELVGIVDEDGFVGEVPLPVKK